MKIPAHVAKNAKCENNRQWKSKKRWEARELERRLNDLSMGCAYFPRGFEDVEVIRRALSRIIDDLSVKNWGR